MDNHHHSKNLKKKPRHKLRFQETTEILSNEGNNLESTNFGDKLPVEERIIVENIEGSDNNPMNGQFSIADFEEGSPKKEQVLQDQSTKNSDTCKFMFLKIVRKISEDQRSHTFSENFREDSIMHDARHNIDSPNEHDHR